MRAALIPYAGQERTIRPRPLDTVLNDVGEARVGMLFRIGNDTAEIASILNCTPAAAANALARIRDRERAR